MRKSNMAPRHVKPHDPNPARTVLSKGQQCESYCVKERLQKRKKKVAQQSQRHSSIKTSFCSSDCILLFFRLELKPFMR